MLIYIDESGDPGFKLERGSSPVFVMSMVMFDDAISAQYTVDRIRQAALDHRVKPEWKFNKVKRSARDGFFHAIRDARFRTRAIMVRKELVRSQHLRNNATDFYRFFTRILLHHDGGAIQNAKVVIDGSGDRKFKLAFAAYIRRELNPGTVRKLDFKDSKRDPLLQLADMTAGAIARSYRDDRVDGQRWRQMLTRHGQLENVWDFG